MDFFKDFLDGISGFYGILLIILFFGGSIFIHELGHFLAARWRKLKIERFSMGMGPRLFGWTGKDGVDYRVSLFPVGGYVALPQLGDMEAIEGKSSSDPDELPPISYTDKVIVSVAGVVFNVLFAFVLGTVLWVTGRPVPPNANTTTIGYVVRELPGKDGASAPSPAFVAGLREGDKILAVDGVPVNSFTEIMNKIALGNGRDEKGEPKVTFSVARPAGDSKGKFSAPFDVVAKPSLVDFNPGSGDRMRQVGIVPSATLTIERVETNSPAERGGLRPFDTIVTLDNEPIFSVIQFREKLASKSLFVGFNANDKLTAGKITIEKVEPASPAERAGLKPGDIVDALDDAPVATVGELREKLVEAGARELHFKIRRGGAPPVEEITISPVLREVPLGVRGADGQARTAAVLPSVRAVTNVYYEIEFFDRGTTRKILLAAAPDKPLAKDTKPDAPRDRLVIFDSDLPADSDLASRFRPGEILTRIDRPGTDALDSPKPAAFRALPAAETATLYFSGGGEPATVEKFRAREVPALNNPYIGVQFSHKAELVYQNPFEQVRAAFALTYDSIAALANPKTDVGVGQLMGVISIARTYYNMSDDLRRILWFTLVININLAILNILPLPVLDGGHILIATIQRISRRAIPEHIIAGTQYVFIALFIALMAYIVLYKDILRWHGDTISETKSALMQRYVRAQQKPLVDSPTTKTTTHEKNEKTRNANSVEKPTK